MSLTKVKYRIIDGPIINAQDYGAVGDGSTDDTLALQAGIDAARTSGALFKIPTGTYTISSPLQVGGVSIEGDIRDYRNATGTIIKPTSGSSINGFIQGAYTSEYLTCYISNLRLEDFDTAILLPYAVSCVFENLIIQDVTRGIQLGDATERPSNGPLLNITRNCDIRASVTAYSIDGGSYANENIVYDSFFEGDVAGAYIEVSGNTANNNAFYNTELKGLEGAIITSNINTSFINCYFEQRQTALRFSGKTENAFVSNCMFSGAFEFLSGRDGLIVSDNIASRISFNGNHIEQTQNATRNFYFLKVTSPTAEIAKNYTFINTPTTDTGSFTGYLGVSNLNGRRLEQNETNTSIITVEDTFTNVKAFHEIRTFSDDTGIQTWKTLATIEDAAIASTSSFINVKISLNAEDQSTPYRYAQYLELDISQNGATPSTTAIANRSYGGASGNFQYQVIVSGGDILIQAQDIVTTHQRVNAVIEINAAGYFLDVSQT